MEKINMDLQAFNVTDAALQEMNAMYMPLVVAGVDDKEGYGNVKAARSVVRSKRVEVEKTRKALKKNALEYGRKVDSEAKRITAMITPIEEHLIEQQKIVDDEKARIGEEKRIAVENLIQSRIADLMQFNVQYNGIGYVIDESNIITREGLGIMSDEDYAKIRSTAADTFEFEDALRKEQEEKERAEREQLEQQRQEQERIAKEQAAKEAELKAEQDRIAEQQRQEREKIERERRELEEQRRRDEEERRHQAEMEQAKKDAAEKAKREEQERVEREEQERIEAEKAEKERLEREERLKPDKEKLFDLANEIANANFPEVNTQAAMQIVADAQNKLEELSEMIINRTKTL